MVAGVVCTSDRLCACARIRRSPPPRPRLRFGTPEWEGEAAAPAAQVPADPSGGSRVGGGPPSPSLLLVALRDVCTLAGVRDGPARGATVSVGCTELSVYETN